MASNLTQATRELLDKTWRSAVTYGIPLFYRLNERKQIVAGGVRYEQMYQSATLKSLVQEYGPNDGLQGGSKEIIEKPHWHVAYMQCPVEESVDERVMNLPETDAQLIQLRNLIAKQAVVAIKLKIADRIYGCATDTEIDAEHTYVQGIPSALMPPQGTTAYESTTYGGIPRTTAAYTEWNAADYSNSFAAVTLNKSKLDEWIDAMTEYAEDIDTEPTPNPSNYLFIMGPTLWRRLAAEFEAANIYKPEALVAKQGFDSMMYRGVEIAKDHLLDRMTATTCTHYTAKVGLTGSSSTSAGLVGDSTYNGDTSFAGTQFVFGLDLRTWHLRYYEDRDTGVGPFEMTDFFPQDKIIGGREVSLARVKWKGQLTCDMPRRNIMRCQVS